jgi:hypothetical protein
MEWSRPSWLRGRSLVSCAVMAVTLVVIGLAQTSAGKSTTRSIGFAAKGETFTELYFDDPVAIAHATEGDLTRPKRITVRFRLHNVEQQEMTYRWLISTAGVARTAGALTLASGYSVDEARRVRTGCSFAAASQKAKTAGRAAQTGSVMTTVARPGHVRVVVRLMSPSQSISFCLPCNG